MTDTEYTEHEQAVGRMAARVVPLFNRVVRDKRPICRMEMPQEDIDALGIEDVAWGIPCTVGPCLAVYGFDMDRTELSPDHVIRYEEEPA